MTTIDTITKLSAPWLSILLNIHHMALVPHLEIAEELMLLGGFLVKIANGNGLVFVVSERQGRPSNHNYCCEYHDRDTFFDNAD